MKLKFISCSGTGELHTPTLLHSSLNNSVCYHQRVMITKLQLVTCDFYPTSLITGAGDYIVRIDREVLDLLYGSEHGQCCCIKGHKFSNYRLKRASGRKI